MFAQIASISLGMQDKSVVLFPFFELFFSKKKYLLINGSGTRYEQVSGWVSEWANEQASDVCHSNQIEATVNNQSDCYF